MKSFKRKAAVVVAASLVATALPVSGVENVKAETAIEESVNGANPGAEQEKEQQPVDHLIINQVYGGGGKGETPIQNSFIELYNPTDNEVSLKGYSITDGESQLTFGEKVQSLSLPARTMVN